jgi:SRSO17 transposase
MMDAEIEFVSWEAGLAALHARIAGRFRRSETRTRVQRYVAGLLDRVERKNGWQLAEQMGEAGPRGVQRLLNGSDWDADAVRDDLRAYVVEHLGAPDGVLIIDETGFLKKGVKSVGVQRQYSGTAGRIENCQIGVFVAYASGRGHAFVDRALYLPQGWARDRERRREAGVPEAVAFATKPQLARHMLERAFAADIPAAWVTADEIYGDDGDLRRWLETTGHPYVLAVSCTHPIWREGRQERADHLVAALPPAAWAMQSAGAGSQGERLFAWAWIQLPDASGSGDARWLLARRSLSDSTQIAYFRAFGPVETTAGEAIRVAGTRWAIEVGFEDAKGVVGLDHYEVRKWIPWHRHVTLVLLAHAYLAVVRHAAARDEAQKGGAPTCSRSRSPKSGACSLR